MLMGSCLGSSIGICYGRNADDLPTLDKASQLAQLHKIKYFQSNADTWLKNSILPYYPSSILWCSDFDGKGSVDMTPETNVTSSNGTWCIASSTASEDDLKSALDWACSSGNVDCSAIQPSQTCYEPDSLVSHAYFAFNSYYQQNGATDIACGFGGSGVKTNKNPSYDKCLYMTAGLP